MNERELQYMPRGINANGIPVSLMPHENVPATELLNRSKLLVIGYYQGSYSVLACGMEYIYGVLSDSSSRGQLINNYSVDKCTLVQRRLAQRKYITFKCSFCPSENLKFKSGDYGSFNELCATHEV